MTIQLKVTPELKDYLNKVLNEDKKHVLLSMNTDPEGHLSYSIKWASVPLPGLEVFRTAQDSNVVLIVDSKFEQLFDGVLLGLTGKENDCVTILFNPNESVLMQPSLVL